MNTIKTRAARALALVSVSAMSLAAHAAGENPLTAAMDAVDLAGIGTKVGALALVVVAIALAFKGPDLAKRVIRKV